jgi:hypothetical protein
MPHKYLHLDNARSDWRLLWRDGKKLGLGSQTSQTFDSPVRAKLEARSA